jgi:hypothetical protein
MNFAFRRSCQCGHSRIRHEHYRRGTDCHACECRAYARGYVVTFAIGTPLPTEVPDVSVSSYPELKLASFLEPSGKIADLSNYGLLKFGRKPAPERHEHALHLYGDDAALLDVLERYILEGDRLGQRTVLFATPERLGALAERMDLLGLAHVLDGHDAAEALSQFIVDGVPDEAKFAQVVHDTLIGYTATNVRLYGEMVAVLWREGNITGALQLEQLWNVYLSEHPVPLLCAYAQADVGEHPQHDAVLAAHSRLVH